MAGFTAHNIRLDDGTDTASQLGWFIADSPWMLSAKRLVKLVFSEQLADKSVVDLGCLEGGYSVEFARMGMNTTGIEVRQSNYDNCEFAKTRMNLPNLRFIKDNVWNLHQYGSFDVTFCCGLLYHLENARTFIEMMAKHTRRLLIINTHVALEETPTAPQLGEMTEHEGMRGRWYREYNPEEMNAELLEAAKWTSWENNRSFWPTKEALLQVVYNEGFDIVFEQADWLAPDFAVSMQNDVYKLGRRMFVGIRSSG